MSLQPTAAPQVIRIKRKRDDAPLDSLYLEAAGAPEGKRRNTDNAFVFKRLVQEQNKKEVIRQEVDQNGIPVIRTTSTGEEKRDPFALMGRGKTESTSISKSRLAGVQKEQPQQQSSNTTALRRFHLSRPAELDPGLALPRKRARGSEIPTFVERSTRTVDNTLTRQPHAQGPTSIETAQPQEERRLKRPRAKLPRKVPGKSAVVAKGRTKQVEQNEVLIKKMEGWALEQERSDKLATLAAQKASEQLAAEAFARQSKRRSQTINDNDNMDIDNEAEDGDFVYDTYIRHLVTENTPLEPSAFVGQLVIEQADQELWDSYIEGEEGDEKEFETDDEDSNAEDYYGADYPEDEVDEDDEFDRDAYRYRTQGASDEEEWDASGDEKVAWSDDEEALGKGPFGASGWRKGGQVGTVGNDDGHMSE